MNINSVSAADIVVIISAIISICGVIYTTRKNREMNDKELEIEQIMNQKNIDANLKVKTRIEWIQNVRNTSADLISLYYQMLNTTDNDILFKTFLKTQEKNELLILYFGPDNLKKYVGWDENQKDKQDDKMVDIKSNEGKNDLIVEFLLNLNENFYVYYQKMLIKEKLQLDNMRDRQLTKMYNNIIGYENIEIVYDDDGNEHESGEPIFDEKLEAEFNMLDEKVKEYTDFMNGLNQKLILLRNIMRIYLKIEWNRAKSV